MPDGKLTAGSRTAGPVLLVEDDADIRSAMAELLHDEGYDFILAEHGLEALDALDRQTPSLLLTDLLMPVMNGVELIARLRDEPRWADLPIVVMTAAGDRIIGVELESLNLPVLKKPVDIDDFAEMVARYSGARAEQTRSA
jgi:two-component system, chemotaxis family, chemotaxis protein CheY